MLEIVELCREYGTILVVDEVYRFLEDLEGKVHEDEVGCRLAHACCRFGDSCPEQILREGAVDLYGRAISIGVMSKAFGLAGLRIGWCATRNDDLRERLAKYKVEHEV
jgi:aspartate/methionine/tyrosine aminotransferase